MAGWHSLSGYLFFKPGGALGKLKSRKRLWWMFEETKCQLIYYKSQEDAKTKEPLGTINIQGAAISLSLGENNQFIILSDNKEFIMTAENHESMMIWLMGLQAKRDAYAAKTKAEMGRFPTHFRSRATGDWSYSTPIAEEPGEISLQDYRRKRCSSLQSNSLFNSLRPSRLLNRLGDSVDAGLDMFGEEDPLPPDPLVARSLVDLRGAGRSADVPGERHSSGTDNETGSMTDEVFTAGDEAGTATPQPKPRHSLRKMQSDITDHKVAALYREEQGNQGSLSGHSASSDSALDHGSESELSTRLQEMEHELIQAKCDLAVMKNRETCYKSVLEKRDSVIIKLDEKLEQMQEAQVDKKIMDKQLKEEIRVLQNQNRFLNEEIRKLARLQQQEREKCLQQQEKVKGLEAEIERWKRDYLYLLQSTITVPTGDLMDGMEVKLFGGARHTERIQELLEESRVVNPGLPTFEKLAKSEVHIDQYGFKHSHNNEGLLLHYIATQLNVHYSTQLTAYEEHVRNWKEMLAKGKSSLVKSKELKQLCRKGIPVQYRREVWRHLVFNQVRDVMEEKGPHYFSNLCNSSHDSEFAGRYRKQISLDLLRTMPNNVKFNSTNAEGTRKLQQVLQALCIHNSNVGYCQGMNFLAGMCLLFLDAEDAFWTLIAITEKYFATNYFDQFLSGAQADQEVLKDLMHEKLPTLAEHLDQLDIEISTVTLNWFLAVFFDAVPFETLIRIWDCFLLEGPKVLFRFALAILKTHESGILQKRDTISIMRHLKSCARLTYDVEGLVRVAFEELHPFPRRQDIAAKQVVYLNTLKEKLRRREHLRRAFVEKEERFRELDLVPSNALVFECAASYADGLLWVCYGAQNCGKVCLVNAHEGLMHDLNLELDSRILAICPVSQDMLLLGTLSWNLIAYSTRNRQALWNIRLHDTVLSLCCHLEEIQGNKVFAALADGTVAVLENVGEAEPNDDPFYIPVGRCPVTSLALIDNQLWCACGNNVHILHAETLDTMDRFTVSSNPFDHILSLAHSEDGVWIAVKGSSIIELWDHRLLNCRMLYDVKENKHPANRKEEEGCLNHYRITSLLPYRGTIWIGTGDGNLIIYDVLNHPTDMSECQSTGASPSHRGRLERRAKVTLDVDEGDVYSFRDSKNEKGSSREFQNSSRGPKKDKEGSRKIRNSSSSSSSGRKNYEFAEEVEEVECNGVYDDGYDSVRDNESFVDLNVLDVESDGVQCSSKSSSTSTTPELAKDIRSSEVKEEECEKMCNKEKVKRCRSSSCGHSSSEKRSKNGNGSDGQRSKSVDEKKSKSRVNSEGNVTKTRMQKSEGSGEKQLRKKKELESKTRKSNGVNGEEKEVEDEGNKHEEDSTENRKIRKKSARTRDAEVEQRRVKSREAKDSNLTSESKATRKEKPMRKIEKQVSNSNEGKMKKSSSGKEKTIEKLPKSREKNNVKNGKGKISDGCNVMEELCVEVNENNNYVCANESVTDNYVDIIENVGQEEDDEIVPRIEEDDSGYQKEKNSIRTLDNDTVLSQVLKRVHEKRPLPPEESLVTGESSLLSAKDSFLQTLSPISESSDGICAENEDIEENCETQNPVLNVQPPSVPDVFILTVDTMSANDGCLLAPQLSPISEGGESLSGLVSPSDYSDPSPNQKSPNPSNSLSPTNFARCVDQKLKTLYADTTENLPKTPANTPEVLRGSNSNISEISAAELHSLLQKEKEIQEGRNVAPSISYHHETSTQSVSNHRDTTASSVSNIDSVAPPVSYNDTTAPPLSQHLDVEILGTASSASNSSLFTDIQYSCELGLQARIKISDKPIRCLVFTKLRDQPIILSCSGCYGDDEAVLKWTKEPDEKLWTNEPIFELCPVTNRPKTPLYMKQMSASLSPCYGSSESLRNMSSSSSNSSSRRPLLMPQTSLSNELLDKG